MNFAILLSSLLAFLGAVLAIMIQVYRRWYTQPIHSTIRATVGFVCLLIATLSIPTFSGEFDVNLSFINGKSIKISTEVPLVIHAIAWLAVCFVLIICIRKIPATNYGRESN